MKRVGGREFKDRANALLNADEPLVIERHGRPIGAYIPFGQPDRAAAARAAEELSASLASLYAETGLTEEEFAVEFMRVEPGSEREDQACASAIANHER